MFCLHGCLCTTSKPATRRARRGHHIPWCDLSSLCASNFYFFYSFTGMCEKEFRSRQHTHNWFLRGNYILEILPLPPKPSCLALEVIKNIFKDLIQSNGFVMSFPYTYASILCSCAPLYCSPPSLMPPLACPFMPPLFHGKWSPFLPLYLVEYPLCFPEAILVFQVQTGAPTWEERGRE